MLNQIFSYVFSSLASLKTKVLERINLLLLATYVFWQSLVEEKSKALLIEFSKYSRNRKLKQVTIANFLQMI